MKQGIRLAVYSIKESSLKGGSSQWIKAGSAYLNRDDSLNVYLDVLPLDGKLHIREPRAEETAKPNAPVLPANPYKNAQAEPVNVDKLKLEALIDAADRLLAAHADHSLKGYPFILDTENKLIKSLAAALDGLTQ